MNHLREVMDHYLANDVGIYQGMRIEDELAQRAAFEALAKNAMCFDIGSYDLVWTLRPVAELVRLPYDVCWLEGVIHHDEPGELDVLLSVLAARKPHALDGDAFECFVFKRLPPGRPDGLRWCNAGNFHLLPSLEQTLAADWVPDDALPYMRGMSAWIAAFLTALNCANVRKRETVPSPALQKARARRGKPPLFSTWTLELKLPKSVGDSIDRGGTHASPRLHLRRGHVRRLPSGVWTWVQPHVVGNKERGMVHKDYRASFEADGVKTVVTGCAAEIRAPP